MKVIRFITKLIGKSAALFILSVLSMFTIVFNIFSSIYRFISAPIAILGTLIAGGNYLSGDLSGGLAACLIGVFICMFSLRFLLPVISEALSCANESLKDYIFSPMFVTSPVRFTL